MAAVTQKPLVRRSARRAAAQAGGERHASPGAPRTLLQLDATRGIACILVLVAHLKSVRGLSGLSDKMGTAGVAVFFALSGFLITRILLADKERGRGLNAFYNRRAARILPVYFLTLAVLCCVWPGKELGWAATFSFNVQYLTGVREYFHIDARTGNVPPVAHVWSLCVEEHFYWFWPLLVWLLPARFCRWLPVICIAATPVVTRVVVDFLQARGFQPVVIEGLLSRLTPTQLVAISLGALTAFHERRLQRSVKLFGIKMPPLLLLAGLLLFASVAGWQYFRIHPGDEGERLLWRATLFHLACGAAFCLGLASPQLGRLAWLNRIGRLSYGLYLFHLPIYAACGLAQSKQAVSLWLGLAALLATFAVAAVSYRFLEAPLLEWMGKRQNGLLIGRGRLAVSLGSALAIVLAGAFVAHSTAFVCDNPVMPAEWRYVRLLTNGVIESGVDVPEDLHHSIQGAVEAYRWMGVLHVVNAHGFRRTIPVPSKTLGVPRVATVGDSYTWGACVAADQVLAPVTERLLRDCGVHLELLNLGKPGGQVEDTQKVVWEKVLPLEPDMVVYVANADDFAPAGAPSVKYTGAQIRTNPVFGERFRRAIRAMHAACREHEVIFRVMPLTQSLDDDETLSKVRYIQHLCRVERVPLIDIDDYLRDHAGQNFRFSRWDPHPNARCHRLYAEILATELLRLQRNGELKAEPGDRVVQE